MKPINSIQPPTMARPVRFEWDDHDWSGKPHPHESPKNSAQTRMLHPWNRYSRTPNGGILALKRREDVKKCTHHQVRPHPTPKYPEYYTLVLR